LRRRSASSPLLALAARRRDSVERELDAVDRDPAEGDRLAGARLAVVFFAVVFFAVERPAPVDCLAAERVEPVVFRPLVERDGDLRDDVDLPDDDDRREDELLLEFGCGISPIPPCGGGRRGRYRSVAALVVGLALVLAAASPALAAGNPWLKMRVLNIAHQGGEDEFPSKTLYAFHEAMDEGADMLELDVGVTRDNHVVVMHDTSVDRTTNGKAWSRTTRCGRSGSSTMRTGSRAGATPRHTTRQSARTGSAASPPATARRPRPSAPATSASRRSSRC
jgi:Glycerophosphoryl diester phosphodiesterase family